MAFDFPASPTNGQTFTPSGGPTYAWNGTVWNQVSSSPSLLTAQARNRIVNGAMQISQELGFDLSGAFTNNGYAADQWQFNYGGTTAVPRASCTTNEPESNYLRANSYTTVDAAVAAADLVYFATKIEGIRIRDFAWGTAAAKPVVLRFSARCAAVPSLVISAGVRQGVGSHSFVKNVTLSNVWQDFVIPIPGPTIGTWAVDTSLGAYVNFSVMVGATFLTTAENTWEAGSKLGAPGIGNFAAVALTLVDLKNVGLYLDDQNTGLAPPWVMPDEAEELRACMRYWQSLTGDGFLFSGNVTSAGSYFAGAVLDIPMRNTPAISGTNAANTSFPATVGSFTGTSKGVRETRVANVTSGGWFLTNVTLNARM